MTGFSCGQILIRRPTPVPRNPAQQISQTCFVVICGDFLPFVYAALNNRKD
ncbi:hypothetical protein Z949_401 [Sulfitobacter guttiformis KCTC 32187]|nr:hypothetical protein Z949_401 [Sulfitobacter guttiformis KCTC 32187]